MIDDDAQSDIESNAPGANRQGPLSCEFEKYYLL